MILLSFPHQALHALSAIFHDRASRGVPRDAPVHMFVWSFCAADHFEGSRFRQFLMRIVAVFPNLHVCFPGFVTRVSALSPYRTVMRRSAWLRKRLGECCVTALYYSHDASADHTAQALMQAFPEARRICFGDPPGFLYPPCTLEAPTIVSRGRLLDRFWRSRLKGVRAVLVADCAILVLRMKGADCGIALPAVVEIPREVVLDVLHRMIQAWGSLSVVKGAVAGLRPCLLILGNFHESGMMSREDELNLYRAICEMRISSGSTLMLKPHFGMSARMLRAVCAALAPYGAVLLPDDVGFLPVEMLPLVTESMEIASVSSSSALLVHLFGEDVRHVLSSELIDRFFSPEYKRHMHDANRAMQHVIGEGG